MRRATVSIAGKANDNVRSRHEIFCVWYLFLAKEGVTEVGRKLSSQYFVS